VTPTPDVEHALLFLRQLLPGGPWTLYALDTRSRGAPHARTFDGTLRCADDVRQWLQIQHEAERGVYWAVNEPRVPDAKAKKEELASVRFLHVDLDPRAGEDFVPERERMLATLTAKRPAGVPEPTCIVDSGNGYQAVWKLQEPVALDGPDDIERMDLYNKRLELVLGGDHCFNIDRILRLPGTVNFPDARKRARGRTPRATKIASASWDNVHPLGLFKMADAQQRAAAEQPPRVVAPTSVRRLASLDDLDQYGVDDRIKVAILHGKDDERPKPRDNSRSAWVFDVACQLVRAKVPDDVIFSVLTDPDFKISASVLECGRNAERYALRQIERAKREADEPELRELNERHFVARNIGGKTRVVEEVYDAAFDRHRLTFQSFDDFRNSYMHRQVEAGRKADGGLVMKRLGHWWLDHAQRRQYDFLVFAPGAPERDGYYNLWRGFAYDPVPGDWSLLKGHLLENVCSGNEVHFAYLLRWMARAVQKPGEPAETAVVLRGDQGVGKGFPIRHFGRLFGRHFLPVSQPSHLVGNFNQHLRDCVLLFADEAFYAGDKKHESVLKSLITEPTIAIEAKGRDVETQPNYIHLMMASNEKWVVPTDVLDRRFFVVDVAAHRRKDTAYFRAVVAQLEAGGYGAMLHELLTLDLTGWHPGEIPESSARAEQKLLSLRGPARYVYELLCSGEPPLYAHDYESGQVFVPTEPLCRGDLKLQTGVGRELAKAAGGATSVRAVLDDGRERRGYWLPPLATCRRNWAEAHGLPVRWPSGDDRWVGSPELPL
jgi:hypothetical protein